MEQQPEVLEQAETTEIPLSDRQRQVLGCFACLSGPDEELVVGGTQSIEECADITLRQRREVQRGLARKGLLRTIKPEKVPEDVKVLGVVKGYELTNVGRSLAPDTADCSYADSRRNPSANPYVKALETEKSVLDCMRCLSAQDSEPTLNRIALCMSDTPFATVRTVVRRLETKNIIADHCRGGSPLPIKMGRPQTIYTATEQSAAFLTPSAMPGCDTLQKEAKAFVDSYDKTWLEVIGCIASQQQHVEADWRDAISEAPAIHCSEAAGAAVRRVFAQLAFGEGLRIDNPEQSPRYYTITEVGKRLVHAYAERYSREDCPGLDNSEDDGAMLISQKNGTDALLGCLNCIVGQQTDKGLSSGVSSIMAARCLGVYPETIAKWAGRLVKSGDITAEAVGRVTVFRPQRFAQNRLSPDCSYKVTGLLTGGVSIQKFGDISSLTLAENLPLLTVEEEVELATIVQTSEDFNEVNAAVQELFIRNLKMVSYIVRKHRLPFDCPSIQDLEQVAYGALLRSAKGFDPTYGVKFSSYAGQAIRNGIDTAIAKHQGVSYDRFRLTLFISGVNQKFVQEYERQPTEQELVDRVEAQEKRPPGNVRAALLVRQQRLTSVSTDEPALKGGSKRSIGDDIPTASAEEIVLNNIDTIALPTELEEVDRLIYQQMLEASPQYKSIRDLYGLSVHDIQNRQRKITNMLSHPSYGFLANVFEMYSWQYDAACFVNKRTDLAIASPNHTIDPTEIQKICGSCSVTERCKGVVSQLPAKPKSGIWYGTDAHQIQAEYAKNHP